MRISAPLPLMAGASRAVTSRSASSSHSPQPCSRSGRGVSAVTPGRASSVSRRRSPLARSRTRQPSGRAWAAISLMVPQATVRPRRRISSDVHTSSISERMWLDRITA